MTQSQAASVVNESLRADAIPLLDQTAAEVSTTTFEVTTSKIESQIIGDKTPLPFEEIPGPAILKIWEKYWKYVPLLGTQVLSSLLINRFTQGTICWSTNRLKFEETSSSLYSNRLRTLNVIVRNSGQKIFKRKIRFALRISNCAFPLVSRWQNS